MVDGCCALAAAVVGCVIRFGVEPRDLGANRASIGIAVLLPLVWLAAMHMGRTYEQRFLWVGPEEFRRVFSAAVLLVAAVGTVSWGFKLEVARGFVVIALPLAMLLSLVQRGIHRWWLLRARAQGKFHQTALLAGYRSGVAALYEQLKREPQHGYRVIGCCLSDDPVTSRAAFNGLPVLGDLNGIPDVVRQFEVDTVAVLPSAELDGPALRRLGWDLEDTRAELLLAPAITEIAGPRVRIRPVCGLPLLHLERPELRGVRRLAKGTFDRVGAAAFLLLLLPVLLGIALTIRLIDNGEIFYRQERVGRAGSTFSMLKFRTMMVGADRMVDTLATQNDGNGVLFKLRSDPRVTRVGRALRRYSLDELPQLINVLRGDMSLVGPRPPLAVEVERYGYDMRRRFLVKPGITGLWQVSGRSNLSWEDSVRIDVRYVENWSLAFDFMILWKTAGAVFRASGAY
jgi:exopolysaccharide biosynthesis polyprenyl glycosylphosphotransferase